MLRSLPAFPCYDELRRNILLSSNTIKYKPELLREMIVTAESRSEDWDKNILGHGGRKKTQITHGGSRQGKTPNKFPEKKPAAKARSDGCFQYGGNHF